MAWCLSVMKLKLLGDTLSERQVFFHAFGFKPHFMLLLVIFVDKDSMFFHFRILYSSGSKIKQPTLREHCSADMRNSWWRWWNLFKNFPPPSTWWQSSQNPALCRRYHRLLQPTPPPQIGQWSSHRLFLCLLTRSPPFRHPDTIMGTTCGRFLLNCSFVFQQKPGVYLEDCVKFTYGINLVRGRAGRWANSLWESKTLESFASFSAEMQWVFKQPFINQSSGKHPASQLAAH